MKRIPRNIIALGVVSLCTDIATEMMYPLIPVFVSLLGQGALALGVIEGVAETTAALLKLFSGILSDRIRKRKLLVVIGYGISSIIRPITGAVSDAWQIVGIRTFDRVGKGIRTAPRDALIASSVDDTMRGKAFGFDRAMDHTGAVIGPLLAAASFLFIINSRTVSGILPALRYTFFLSAIPGIAAIVTAVFFVREVIDARHEHHAPGISLKNFDRNFLTYLAILFLFTLGNSSDAFLLFRAEETIRNSGTVYAISMHLPVVGNLLGKISDVSLRQNVTSILFLPVIWAYFHIIKALLSTPVGALSDRAGRKRVINFGWGIYACVYFAFALLDRFPAGMQVVMTFILFGIYAFFYAFTEGVEKAFVADLVEPSRRGSAYGLYNFTVGIGALPASIIFGWLYNSFGGAAAFSTGAVLAFLAMTGLAFFVREKS